MELNKVAESLTKNEITILKSLSKTQDFNKLLSQTKLKEVELNRGLLWLEHKNLIKINTKESELINLDSNGKLYLKSGLPEKRFLDAIKSKPLPINKLEKSAKLSKEELNVSIGLLKRNNYIKLGKEVEITKQGKDFLKENLVEKLLKSLPQELEKLSSKEQSIVKELKTRKQIIIPELVKERTIELTDQGKRLSKLDIKTDLLETLTPEMLMKGNWKNKQFRRYDIKAPVPKFYPGKRHFVNLAIQHAKKIWLEMGFTEMTGPIINTSFWTFDALFAPQDHPAREMQDTFFLEGSGKLPDKKLVNKVRKSHEEGWKYKWSENIAKTLVLRTHTTVLSALTLAKLKESDLPAKFFAIGRNYRNEAVDWKHLFEFNQTEGIVVGKDLTFRDLLGYLKEFFSKMGFPQARFRPAYFPYTECSVEIDVFHPKRKTWVELGGAGIFRPEVVEPLLGKDIQVLAWGPGFDRIIKDYYNIEDIRDLYKNEIKQLREIKGWFK